MHTKDNPQQMKKQTHIVEDKDKLPPLAFVESSIPFERVLFAKHNFPSDPREPTC